MASTSPLVGASIRRREDPALITGQGTYVADIQLDNMAYMVLLRSPYAHARIKRIDTSQAKAMDGVVAVMTGSDINSAFAKPMSVFGERTPMYKELNIPAYYPLATDVVRHAGEPVALVVAEDSYVASDALEAIVVDYEPLPVVVDLEEALDESAVVLHEEFGTNLAYHWVAGSDEVETVFADAEVTVELRVVNQRLIPNAIEPRGVVATYDPDSESYTVWTSTQIPHAIKMDLSGILGTPPPKVRIIAPEVGGGFGAKASFYREEALAPAVAKQISRPISWVASRSEDYLATIHGRDQITTMRLAASKDGRVLAADLKAIGDCGSFYSRRTPFLKILVGMMMTGIYDIPVARVEALGAFTNKGSLDPYRGAGRPEPAYMIERAMDLLARELDIDAAEVRRRNFISPSSFPYKTPIAFVYDSGEYERALDKALELVDYKALRQRKAEQLQANSDKLLGIGIASYAEVAGLGPFEYGSVSVDEEGKVTALTGSNTQGQGHETAWAQIVADALQIPMEDISIKHGDTAIVPKGVGTFASRSIVVGAGAVHQNAEVVRERAEQIAAHLLEAAAEDVTLDEGRFRVVGSPANSVTWSEVAQAAGSDSVPEEIRGELKSEGDFQVQGFTFPFGVHICVVQVDKQTGKIEIERFVAVDDCGKIINPMIVEGQIHGGLAQGIGQALLEGAVYDALGNLVTGSLMDYAVPRADQFPHFETYHTETPTPRTPLGAKGVGESSTVGSTPAVVNAVVDALSHLGITHLDMPLTAERVWRAINSK